LKLGERSPLSVHDGLPPSWLPNTLALEGWTTALDLRRALVAALIEQRGHTPALKDEIWRLDRDLKDPVGAEKRMRKQSEDVTEWLERQVQIPEGSHYSRALELLGFQKEVIAQIYDNPGAVPKCAADPEG
jgi:hypothetical protein